MDFITVSRHPAVYLDKDATGYEPLKNYDVIINVSDHLDAGLSSWLCANAIEHYWLPFGESYGMPLENIFAAMQILWRAESEQKKVLVHCMAGRNRSWMISDCYRYMMTGEYDETSAMMLNVKDSQLPGIYRLELFLQKCLEVFNNPEVAGGALIDWVKKETLGF
jgi:protein-tyrosine phosphatase